MYDNHPEQIELETALDRAIRTSCCGIVFTSRSAFASRAYAYTRARATAQTGNTRGQLSCVFVTYAIAVIRLIGRPIGPFGAAAQNNCVECSYHVKTRARVRVRVRARAVASRAYLRVRRGAPPARFTRATKMQRHNVPFVAVRVCVCMTCFGVLCHQQRALKRADRETKAQRVYYRRMWENLVRGTRYKFAARSSKLELNNVGSIATVSAQKRISAKYYNNIISGPTERNIDRAIVRSVR